MPKKTNKKNRKIRISLSRNLPITSFHPSSVGALDGLTRGETLVMKFESESDKNLFLITLISSLDEYSRQFSKTQPFDLNVNLIAFEFRNGIRLSRHAAPDFLKNTVASLHSHASQDNLLNGESFYSCNVPEQVDGYTAKEQSEDIYIYEKDSEDIQLWTQIGTHRTHYLKWELLNNPSISIRYHFTFADRTELEGKYIWKDHDTKNTLVLTKEQAEIMINNMGFLKVPVEIVGKLTGGKYRKSTLVFKNDRE